MRKAFICGMSGTVLTNKEASFLTRERPAGVILFSRNVETPEQLSRLITDARSAIGADDILILVDQEGGRVQRLAKPHWRTLPAASSFASRIAVSWEITTAVEAAHTIAQLTAHDLRTVGINVNCVPCADMPVADAHDIIGARAYGTTLKTIVPLAKAVAEAHMDMGVLPVIKHIPGHGRATVDSHLSLPMVDTRRAELTATDFAAFYELRDLPAAMTAHVVYTAIDSAQPATTSNNVIAEVIRGDIGFDGLLMSDDLSMKALQGSLGDRSAAAIAAGCDIALHCNGDFTEMTEVANAVPIMNGQTHERFMKCAAITARKPFPLDISAAEQLLAEHMQSAAA